jgi:hypothetical protein
MYDIKKRNFHSNFKPMMTHGLENSSGLFMLNKTNGNIIFGHHPQLETIFCWFNQNWNDLDDFLVVIKSPGEWNKTSYKWKLKAQDEQMIETYMNKQNVSLELIPYIMDDSYDKQYNNTFYCRKVDNKLVYLCDNYGKFKYVEIK